MTPLFQKLNIAAHREIVLLNPPRSFERELKGPTGVTVRRSPNGTKPIGFSLAFVRSLVEVQLAAEALLPNAPGDPTIWFAYPKGTSKNYTCEFNRDNGWSAVRQLGFDTVRSVSIDDDWSALRFQ